MPKVLADGRIKLVALTTAPANPAAPTVAELNAGIDISCKVMHSDYSLGPTDSDTMDEKELCALGNGVVLGSSNYAGSITIFRYLDEAGTPDAAEDVAWDLFKEKGAVIWLYEREGQKYTEGFAVGDVVDGFEFTTDWPKPPSSRTGYIKRGITLAPTGRMAYQAVVAAA